MKRVVAKMRKGATKLEVAQALRLMECRKLEARFVNHRWMHGSCGGRGKGLLLVGRFGGGGGGCSRPNRPFLGKP